MFTFGIVNLFANHSCKWRLYPMDYKEIHEALKQKGLNWSICAEAFNCSASHLMNVAARRAGSKHIATKLSKVLGKPVNKVFPDVPTYFEEKNHDRQIKVSALKAALTKMD